MQFADLRLAEPLLRAVASEGYTVPTPIQAQAIPLVLRGQDVLACAQTGTGKTAAFALPILHRLLGSPAGSSPNQRRVKCLVLCPTRELATQIGDSFRAYGRHLAPRLAVVFGGVNERPQIEALNRGVDVLIATPGRLLDLTSRGYGNLSSVETLVLDEADRMLDMGFIHDIRKLVARLPQRRQTMLFSATMPPEIRRLADSILHNAASVQVAPPSATADNIDQSVYFVERQNKPTLLAHLVDHLPMTRALVFTRTKHGADRVARQLQKHGIRAEALHGNKSQNARQRALDNFRSSRTPVLVATDIASRGIDIDGITHVVNYDLTHEPETYVHRIGRTARAGGSGAAVSFCDREEMLNLQAIQKLIRQAIPVRTDHPAYSASAPKSEAFAPIRRSDNAHRANSPAGHRAGSPAGHRTSAPAGHRTKAPTGHRAGAPAGQRAGAATGRHGRPSAHPLARGKRRWGK